MVFRYDNRIIFTEDRGKTWSEASTQNVEGEKDPVTSLNFGPNGKLWLGTLNGRLYSSTDRRNLVLAGKGGLPPGEFAISSIAINTAKPNELLMGLVERSPDLDTAWKAANNFEGETEPTPTPTPSPTPTPPPTPTPTPTPEPKESKIFIPIVTQNK